MGVTGADKIEAVRILDTQAFEGQAISQGLAHVASLWLAVLRRGHAKRHDLEIRPFIGRRQQGMGFGRSFDLGDLDQRLVADPLHGIAVVNGIPGPIYQLEYLAIAAVRVVGDRQAFDALFAQVVHPLPESFGILGVEAGEGDRRNPIAALEDHVAVEVAHVVTRRGVLVGDEGRETPGIVVPLGGVDRVLPGSSGDVENGFALDGLVLDDGQQEPGEECPKGADATRDPGDPHVVRIVDAVQGLGDVQLREGGRDVPRLRRDAEKHRGIRHCVEIKGLLQLERNLLDA